MDEVAEEDQRAVAHFVVVVEIKTVVAVGAPSGHRTVETDGLSWPAEEFGVVGNSVRGRRKLIEMQVVLSVRGQGGQGRGVVV